MNGALRFGHAQQIIGQLSLDQCSGQLLVVGFRGAELPASIEQQLVSGRRGGVILFKRNLPDIDAAWRLCRRLRAAFPSDLPPFIGVDEEGGRVSRLPAPFERLAPMRRLGAENDLDLTRRAGEWLGRQLAAVGFTWDFAPVLDVDSNPDSPIIADRSFSSDPAVVARHGVAFGLALQSQGIGACGKHFPGHGDASLDSHLALPTVQHAESRLQQVEVAPFRVAAQSGLASFMTAHISYPQLDPTRAPATFSSTILTNLLRTQLGFPGVLFSDDLEMGAVSQHHDIETAACAAVRAGCDAILICHDEDAAARAHAALTREAQRNEVFRARIIEAATRLVAYRDKFQVAMASTQDELWQAIAVRQPDFPIRTTGGP